MSVNHCSKPDGASSASLSRNERDEMIPSQVQAQAMDTVPVIGTATNIHGAIPLEVDVLIISRDEIDAYGVNTTAELIARIPELAGANPLGPKAEGNSGLGAAVDLRGQGAGATLILLNGHRSRGFPGHGQHPGKRNRAGRNRA